MWEALNSDVLAWVRQDGLFGLALAMTVENLVQVVPSLVILPLAGHLCARGVISLPLAVAAATAGSLLGCSVWYGLGRLLNERRLEQWVRRRGRWLGLTSARLRHSRQWFQRQGWQMVFWGRFIPVLRTNVSLPAGIELMPLPAFLGWSLLGNGLWNSLWILVGYSFPQARG